MCGWRGYRIHTLEEQLKDMEVKSDERVRVEQRKLHDIVVSLIFYHT